MKSTTITTATQGSVPETAARQVPENLVLVQRYDGREWRDYIYAIDMETAKAVMQTFRLLGSPVNQYRIKTP